MWKKKRLEQEKIMKKRNEIGREKVVAGKNVEGEGDRTIAGLVLSK